MRCASDGCRDLFVEHFWLNRDPTPGTLKNEYLDLYYERLEYVNRMFSRGTPKEGWQTDRGRMYLLLGEPMNTTRYPSSGTVYPTELWFYHQDPKLGIPPFFYLMFFKSHGMGEYRLYSPIVDGVMQLLNPAGQNEVHAGDGGFGAGLGSYGRSEGAMAYQVLQSVDSELAQAAFSLIPGEGGISAMQGMPSLRSEMLIADIESIPERIMPRANWAYKVLLGDVEADVRFETLPVAATAAAFVDPTGAPFVHFAVRTQGGRLNLRNYEDTYYITFSVAGSLVDEERRVLSDIQGPDGGPKILEATLDEEQARNLRSGPIVYLDRLPVVEGDHQLDLMVENNVSREFGRAEFALTVPPRQRQQITSSKALLLREYTEVEGYDPYSPHYPFQVGRFALVPPWNRRFPLDGMFHVFFQIYVPVGRRYTESLEASYRLESDSGAGVDKLIWIDLGQADKYGTITQVTTLDLTELPAGDYRLIIDVATDDGLQMTTPVRIVDASFEELQPLIHSLSHPPATDPALVYERARQYRVRGEIDAAIATLQSALERDPEFEIGIDLQTELLMEAARYEEVNELLVPQSIANPHDPQLLRSLAEVNANLARHYDAIRYYERARRAMDEDTTELLNPLAAAYFADGQAVKARDVLQLSLELDPEQPEIQRLLDEVNRRLQETQSQ